MLVPGCDDVIGIGLVGNHVVGALLYLCMDCTQQGIRIKH